MLLYIYNTSTPKATTEYVYQFSNINGVHLSCRFTNLYDTSNVKVTNINDVKNVTIMDIPQGNFIREV